MADQKPMLDYRNSIPPAKNGKFDITICVVCSTPGLACLLLSVLWAWDIFRHGNGISTAVDNFFTMVFMPVVGFLLLWLAWRIFRRR